MDDTERCAYCNRAINFTDVDSCGPRSEEQPCICCGLIIVATQETPVVEDSPDE